MIYLVEEPNLTIKYIKKIYEEGLLHISLTDSVQVDLRYVKKIDTSGIAVMISWWHYAEKNSVKFDMVINQIIQDSIQAYKLELPVLVKE